MTSNPSSVSSCRFGRPMHEFLLLLGAYLIGQLQQTICFKNNLTPVPLVFLRWSINNNRRVLILNLHNHICRFAITLLTVLALTFQMEANANDKFLVSCPISAGDSLAKVKEFFQTTEEPKEADNPAPGGFHYSYRFPAYGIYIFFDSAKLVQTLRFDPPFAGKIEGISIEDSTETVSRLKGEPAKRLASGFPDPYSLESKKKRKTEIIENLPDPSPKELVRKALEQIAEIDRLPFQYTEARLYKSNERRLLRYDISPSSGKVVTILSDKGTTEPLAPNEPNKFLEERLRNSQVSETRLSNGAVFTEIKFKGSLQPNFDLGCISISEVTSKFNPPALIYAAKKCIQQEQYSKAWALLTTGNGFAYYDLKRLADRSTQGASTVLMMNAFSDLTNAQRDKASKISKEIQTDPEQVKEYCAELTRIGIPSYEPQWAIFHGIGAYQEPRNGHYLTNVDAKSLWDEVLRSRCTPQ